MSAIVRLVFHGLSLTHHLVALASLGSIDYTNHTNQRVLDIKKFSAFYFTGWNFGIQTIFLLLALLGDVAELHDLKNKISAEQLKTINKYRDFIFTTFCFPFSIFVSALFWVVYSYDRELVLPRACDAVVSPFLNHAMHSTIVVVVLGHVLLAPQRAPARPSCALPCLAGTIVLYYSVYLGTYFLTGKWMYAIFDKVTWAERILFFIAASVCIFSLYFIGHHANLVLAERRVPLLGRGFLSPADIKLSQLRCIYSRIRAFGSID